MKDNKFLNGFLIVTLLGAGALGFLLFQAKGKHSQVTEEYNQKVGELKTLQGGKPYPNDANFKKVLELQKTHQQAITDLQQQLAAAEIKVEPLSPEKFQDNLRESIKRVRGLAAQVGPEVIKPDAKFSLGFETYESQPPKPEAAPPLGRMLKAIELVMTELLAISPAEITKDVKRAPLAEEGGQKAPATPAPKSGSGAAAKKAVAEEAPLVKRYPFEIEFVAQETRARTFINKIVAEKKQFFVVTSVRITNSSVTGPSKTADASGSATGTTAAVAATPASPSPDPNAPSAPPPDPNQPAAAPTQTAAIPAEATRFVVGEEKLNVAMVIEVVDFAEPAAEKTVEKTAAKPAPAK